MYAYCVHLILAVATTSYDPLRRYEAFTCASACCRRNVLWTLRGIKISDDAVGLFVLDGEGVFSDDVFAF